jgi:hypothetical protein
MLIAQPQSIVEIVAPTSGDGDGDEIGAVLSMGIESGPDFTLPFPAFAMSADMPLAPIVLWR